jgi:hypothetical protein
MLEYRTEFFSSQEYLKGRDVEYPLTRETLANMVTLLRVLDKVRKDWGNPLIISSGYRPGKYNKAAGGSSKSAHLTCEAVDFVDEDGSLAAFMSEAGRLDKYNLYMESPARTTGWVHLQTRRTASGKRIFEP